MRGVRAALSFAALMLCLAFVGFGAFARDVGFTLVQVILLAVTVWALPSAVVFVAATASGATLFAAAVAVTLSAVRLLPMTVAIMPQMAGERLGRVWFYLAAHFVAITGYVESALRFPSVPADRRLSFFLGLGSGLMVIATSGGIAGYLGAASLPAPIATGLLFVTPMYFLLSMVTAAGTLSEKVALGLGFALAPLLHRVSPDLDLLWAGLIGGTAGFLVHRFGRKRAVG